MDFFDESTELGLNQSSWWLAILPVDRTRWLDQFCLLICQNLTWNGYDIAYSSQKLGHINFCLIVSTNFAFTATKFDLKWLRWPIEAK